MSDDRPGVRTADPSRPALDAASSAGREVGRGVVGAVVAGWFLLSVLLHGGAAHFRFAARGNPEGYGWEDVLLSGLIRTSTWLVIVAAAFVLVRKVPLPRTRWGRFLALHVAAGAVLLVVHEGITQVIAPWVSTLTPMPFTSRLAATTPVLALEYVLVVGLAYSIVYFRRLHEQEILRVRWKGSSPRRSFVCCRRGSTRTSCSTR